MKKCSSLLHIVMASCIHNNLLVSLLFLFLTTCAASQPLRKVHVTIANELGRDVVLLAHCWSFDDDLGIHRLALHASFEFSFRTDLIYQTFFKCQFHWINENHQITQHSTDMYAANQDKCRNCSWIITPDGPCMHNFDAHNLNCYRWPQFEIS